MDELLLIKKKKKIHNAKTMAQVEVNNDNKA